MAIKYLSNISLEGNELQNVKIHPVGTAPSAGQGKLYYDTATNKLMANNGTSWYSVNGSLEDLTSGNASRITIGGTAAAPTVAAVAAVASDVSVAFVSVAVVVGWCGRSYRVCSLS
mgnify:CR=1 FL=1